MTIPLPLNSVPALTPYAQYIMTAGQTVVPYPFPITQDADLVVVVDGVTYPNDVGYTVAGQGNATGGTITLATAQAAGVIVTVYRDIVIERLTQIAQNSGFSSVAFNAEFNNIYLILQQLSEKFAFVLQIPNSNNPAGVTTLTPGSYRNSYLYFDANGNPQPAQLTSSGPISFEILAPILGLIARDAETAAGVTNLITDYLRGFGDLQRYGVAGDGITDDTAALNAIFGAAWASDVTFFCESGCVFNTVDTVTVPGPYCSLMLDSSAYIDYAGPTDRAALVIGSDTEVISGRDFNVSVNFHANANDYLDLGCVGVQIRGCFVGNRVRLNSAQGFTINWQLYGSNDSGIAYNTFDLGISGNAERHLDLRGVSANGFINENLFLNGDFQTYSTYVPGAAGVAYGIVMSADPGGYTGQNKNHFVKPCFQLTQSGIAANRIPIAFNNSGSNNQFQNCRFEGYNGPLVRVTSDTIAVRNNTIDIGTNSTAFGTLDAYMTETDGGFSSGNRITRRGTTLSDRFSSGDLVARAFVPATGDLAVTGMFMQSSASGTATPTGTGKLGKDYVLVTSDGLGVFVDTSYYKNFEVRTDTLTGKCGRFAIVAFEADGSIISSTRAVQFGGLSETASFGGHCYTLGSDQTGFLDFRVDSNVDHIKVIWTPGTAGCSMRSFSVTGFATQVETLAVNNGLAVYTGNTAYKQMLMPAIPTKLGPVFSARGDTISNSVANSGGAVVAGWVCKTAGYGAADWIAATAYKLNEKVNNDTDKIYVCVAEGTSAGAGGPTGTGNGISDGAGGLTWNYVATGTAVWTALAPIT